jgi:sulfopyruvate decarboxylase TPP-binding subunit
MLSLAKTCRYPLLMLVTMRGEYGEFNPWQVPMGQATRATMEAMGVIVLDAWEGERVGETVEAAAKLAFNGQVAVAVCLTQRVIGAKDFRALAEPKA